MADIWGFTIKFLNYFWIPVKLKTKGWGKKGG